MIVLVGLLFLVFDVFEAVGFDVDDEVPAFVVTEGYPVEAHFPAVEVAVEVDGGVGETFVDEVVASGDGDTPVWGDFGVGGDAEGLDDVVFEVVLCSDIGADVAEGVVERYVPGHGEVGIGTHEEGGIVVVGRLHDGCHYLFAFWFSGFVFFVGVECVVVDAV